MSTGITKACWSVFIHLHNIRKIRKNFSEDSLCTISMPLLLVDSAIVIA